ncbi:hypothetical protein ACFV1W_31920 [Kitasatospora sp. NPDC059648]|uniref:hypothetical protein n=1 Tax=Kitasatospora sp. NPDC059648 TaxID=3346894 RepID=UPI00369A9E82
MSDNFIAGTSLAFCVAFLRRPLRSSSAAGTIMTDARRAEGGFSVNALGRGISDLSPIAWSYEFDVGGSRNCGLFESGIGRIFVNVA